MLHITQESKICWLRAGMIPICGYNVTTPRAVFVCILIYSIVLLNFPIAHANEDLEIRKVFDDVAKYIKADEKYKDFDVIEKKVISLISKLHRILASILAYTPLKKKQKIPLNLEITRQPFLSLTKPLQNFLIIKML